MAIKDLLQVTIVLLNIMINAELSNPIPPVYSVLKKSMYFIVSLLLFKLFKKDKI